MRWRKRTSEHPVHRERRQPSVAQQVSPLKHAADMVSALAVALAEREGNWEPTFLFGQLPDAAAIALLRSFYGSQRAILVSNE